MFDISDVDFVNVKGNVNDQQPVWTLRCRNDNDLIEGKTKNKKTELHFFLWNFGNLGKSGKFGKTWKNVGNSGILLKKSSKDLLKFTFSAVNVVFVLLKDNIKSFIMLDNSFYNLLFSNFKLSLLFKDVIIYIFYYQQL